MEYFEFYGIPVTFLPDEPRMREMYLIRQKEWHPDFYISDPEKYEFALKQTTLNNLAYNTLKDQWSRLRYILQTTGRIAEGEKNILPQDFLMEMLDIQDLIEEAVSGNENARMQAAREISSLKEKNNNRFLALVEKHPGPVGLSDADWDAFHELYQIDRYLSRLSKNLEGKREM